MPIRITGMNSGLDTESIITELVKAKSAKKDELVKAQTKLQWKQWLTLFFWSPKSLQMVIAAMKLKDAFSLEGKL